MKDTIVVDNINELSALSRKLNKKSDNLNETITSINSKLGQLNLGVEVWLLNSPVESGDPYYLEHDEDERWPHVDGTVLGYARVEDEWQLAVKEATLLDFDPNSGTSHPNYNEVKSSRSSRPLLQANRAIRVNAMSLIPSLLDELKEEAGRMLRAIEQAEKAAENL